MRGGLSKVVGRAAAALAMIVLAGGLPAPPAGARGFAPVDTPGPPLSVPAARLDAAISCSVPPTRATRDIIVVVPPTVFDPGEAYGWNYERAFGALHWPYCAITMPDHTDGDIQVAAEYIVNAVRLLHSASGRQVELFGWSQGASTSPRWALRWWPDIRPMVTSLVGLAPDNERGSDTVEGYCTAECVPAAWQQVQRINGSPPNFMVALDSGQQTFSGIAYTDIYSLTDEVAGLNVITPPVSPLPPAPNVLDVSTQSICPAQAVEHLDIPASSAAYAVAVRALADPGRLPQVRSIPASVCDNPLMPFVTPSTLAANEAHFATLLSRLAQNLVSAEPPLRCYVTASC